jgi:hypothetical protein
MSLFLLPICYILRNGMTVDDLGLVLVGGAVLILMIRLTCRAVRILTARLIVPAVHLYLNMLVGGVSFVNGCWCIIAKHPLIYRSPAWKSEI